MCLSVHRLCSFYPLFLSFDDIYRHYDIFCHFSDRVGRPIRSVLPFQ